MRDVRIELWAVRLQAAARQAIEKADREALLALRCSVSGSRAQPLPLVSRTRPIATLVAPLGSGSRDTVEVTCMLSLRGTIIDEKSKRHPLSFAAEGRHVLKLSVRADSSRLSNRPVSPLDRLLVGRSATAVDIEIEYSLGIELDDVSTDPRATPEND